MMKICTGCRGEPKPLAAFYMTSNSRGQTMPHSRCKECRKAQFRKWAKRPESIARKAERRRQQEYGLTPGEHAALLAAQGGRCKVCRTDKPGGRFGRTFMVDHDHETGVIRGLLCQWCNSAIGYAKDNPATLRALADYLGQAKKDEAKS